MSTTPKPLYLFLSSKMLELKSERDALYSCIPSLGSGNLDLRVWQFEATDGATASDTPIRDVYLQALEDAALYIGIFWNGYGEWTVDEFDRAGEWGVDRQIYVKDVDAHNRDPKLTEFLHKHGSVVSGVTAKWFKTTEELCEAVKASVNAWIMKRSIRRPGASSALFIKRPAEILERPPVFMGRDNLVSRVNNLLNGSASVLLQGLGGMGKTALAAEIVHRRMTADGKSILWLKAGNESSTAIFEALARPFNQHKDFFRLEGDALILAVRQWLIDINIGMLVLDDVWNGKALMQVIKAIPSGLPLLITSRQRFPVANILEVERLDRTTAMGLLLHHSALSMVGPGMDSLCEKLGDQAFAICVAGMTLKVDELPASDLLERIEKAPHDLKVPLEFANEYEQSFSALIEVSLNALYLSGRTGKEAHALFLAFGALFSPTATSELLSIYLQEVIVPAGNTSSPLTTTSEQRLTELRRRGLVDRMDRTGDTLSFYRVHDLAFYYAQAQSSDQLHQKALNACMAYLNRYSENRPEHIEAVITEINNLLGAAQLAYESGRFDDVETLAIAMANTDGGNALNYRGLFRQALDLLELAVDAAKQQKKPFFVMMHLCSIANVYKQFGQFRQTLVYYDQALEIAEHFPFKPAEGIVFMGLADTMRFLGEFEKAEEYLLMALSYMNPGDKVNLALIQRDLGLVYKAMGRYNDAIALLNRALADYNALGNKEMIADTLGDLGAVASDMGNHSHAIDFHEKALQINIAIGNKVSECNQLGNLGYAYVACDNFDKSIEYYDKALLMLNNIGNRYWEAAFKGGLGRAYLGLGQLEKASEYFEAALTIDEGLGHKRGCAIHHGYLATLFLRQNQHENAIQEYLRAIEIGREIGDWAGVGTWLNAIGTIYHMAGQRREAMEYYQQALRLLEETGIKERAAATRHNIQQLMGGNQGS